MKGIAERIGNKKRRCECEDSNGGVKKDAPRVSSHGIKSMQHLSDCDTQIAFILANMAALEKD